MDPTGLSQTAINVAVGGLVLTLTQTTKRWTPEGWGPIIAAIWTTLALVVWLLSQPDWPPSRSTYFDILAVWVSIYATALGLYSAAMIPSNSRQSIGAGNVPMGETSPPAGGAGSEPSIKSGDLSSLPLAGRLTPEQLNQVAGELERRMRATPADPASLISQPPIPRHPRTPPPSEPDALISKLPPWLPGERG